MTATETIHPFEKAGLGKAPFRLVGLQHQEIRYGEAVIGSVGGIPMTTKPGGTCAYCGQYIINMFNIESSDGHKFHVGCDCVDKVRFECKAPIENANKVPELLKKLKKDRESKRIAEAIANLPNAHGLRSQKHPNAFQASEGKSLADYCEWLFKNAGTSGKLRAARLVEMAMTPKVEE